MIPYEALAASLSRWRQRNGLPNLATVAQTAAAGQQFSRAGSEAAEELNSDAVLAEELSPYSSEAEQTAISSLGDYGDPGQTVVNDPRFGK